MKIFISYRRDDSAGYAGRLFDYLSTHFGGENVFMDIDTIKPGDDFRKVVRNAVGSCNVVLVMIGKQWLNITDGQGRRRLEDPGDWVGVEIATALSNPDIRVIPVLLRGASMPGEDELPPDLKELSWRNAHELSDSRFQHDAGKLISVIEQTAAGQDALPAGETQKRNKGRGRGVSLVFSILVVIIALYSIKLLLDSQSQIPDEGSTPEGEWSGFIDVMIDPADYCSIAFMFPAGIDPSTDPVKASEELQSQQRNGLTSSWPKVPANEGSFKINLTGLSQNLSWIKLSNTAQASISLDQDIPDHVNVIQDCAAAGEIRDFPPISLEANGNIKEYSLDVRYPEADFFTLQPGEPEIFRFSFMCKAPGAYRVQIEIPFEYEDQDGLIPLLSQTLLCPEAFTKWSALAGNSLDPIVRMSSYQWNGTEYVEVP